MGKQPAKRKARSPPPPEPSSENELSDEAMLIKGKEVTLPADSASSRPAVKAAPRKGKKASGAQSLAADAETGPVAEPPAIPDCEEAPAAGKPAKRKAKKAA